MRADCFPRPRDLPAPPSCSGLDDAIPSLTDLGYGDASVDKRGDFFDPKGGETAALERLQRYVWDEDRLKTYFDTRNGAGPRPFTEAMPRVDASLPSTRPSHLAVFDRRIDGVDAGHNPARIPRSNVAAMASRGH